MPPVTLHIDFETRSTLDLREVGLWNYVRHPSTDVWCMAWAYDEDEIRLWNPRDDLPHWPPTHLPADIKVVAHNAPFELAVWNEIMVKRYGWPRLRPTQAYCTMAQAYAMGLPGGLEDAALALGLSVLKDAEGRSLMLRMARPRRMEGDTPIWWDDPEKLQRLYEYCKQDVRVERELEKRLAPLSERERQVWLMDYDINQRGVAMDLETARAGTVMVVQIQERAAQELTVLTGGAVTTATALIPLKQWLDARGCKTLDTGLAKDVVDAMLKSGQYSPEVTRALLLRQEAGKASVAKLDKMLQLAGSDGRLHNWGQYCGSHLGRWAARGVQVHNLVRDMPPPQIVEEILGHVRDGALEWIDMAYGPPMTMISRCLRSFFVAPPGTKLIAGDFNSVEGRGTAWISGEEWKLRAFRAADAKTGPGIYELTASKTLGVPVDSITKDSAERFMGKVQELAFGYQGGVGAARKFLPASMNDTPDKVLNQWKFAWRDAHPKIVATWKELEAAAIAAVRDPGGTYTAGFPGRGVAFRKAGSFLWCQLPSKRVICYPYPKLLPGTYGEQLTYMAVPGEDTSGIIADVKNANNWARVSTYGGSLMENVVQALCRDLLVDVMLDMHARGQSIVLHVHDEIVREVADNGLLAVEGKRVAMETAMRTPPAWAADFPLWADCKIMQRYGK